MNPPADTSPEALLEHASWMRAMAVALVSDPNEAEDVAQEAALAALLHPPPQGAALRPWLATVLRRLVWRRRRSELRRADHESRLQRPPGDPGQMDALEHIDTQRVLLEAVRKLEEPLRTTVVRRYFEGKTSAEIARSSGLPAGTVRARLKRALDGLREQLDDEWGSRGAWIALIVPLVPGDLTGQPVPTAPSQGPAAPALHLPGFLTMSLVKTTACGALAAIAAFAAWEFSSSVPGMDLARSEPAASVESPEIETAGLEPAQVEDTRAAAVTTPPPVEQPEQAAAPADVTKRRGSLDARFVDEHGNPWADVEVLVFFRGAGARDRKALAQDIGDGSGLVSLVVPLSRFAVPEEGGPAVQDFELLARHPDCVSHRQKVIIRQDQITHLGDVVLATGARVSGRIVDQRGAAVPGARVGAVDAELLDGHTPQELDRIARIGCDAFDFLTTVTSRADGTFDLSGIQPGRVRLWAYATELRFGLGEPLELEAGQSAAGALVLLADFLPTDRISGQVVDPDGTGHRAHLVRMAGAGDRTKVDSISTDGQGRFSFEIEYLDAVYNLTARDPFNEFTRVQVSDVRPGDLDVLIAFEHGQPLVLHLRDEQGAPVLDAEVSIGIDGFYGPTPAESLEPGDYTIARPSGKFRLEASAPGFRELNAGRHDGATVPAELTLTMTRALRLRGVVLAGGEPVADAVLEVFEYDSDAEMTVNGLRCPISSFERGRARSDAEGRFEIDADVDGHFVLRARHEGWVDVELGPLSPERIDGPLQLELSRGGTIQGVVLVPPGEALGDRVVAVHRGDGRPRCTRTAADGTYQFEGLMPGDWRVFPLETEFDPHGGSYSSYDGDEPLEWHCRVELGVTTTFDLDLTGQ